MPACCAICRATRASKSWSPRAARRLWLWRANSIPTAISLDVFLPDMLGWTVLNHLKQDPATRHIPVQMLTLDEDRHHGLARGLSRSSPSRPRPKDLDSALGRIKEYATPRRKRLLVVEDNPAEQLSIRELLGYDDIDVSSRRHGQRSARSDQRRVRSIAWCSICACRTCPASTSWSSCATRRRCSDLPVVVFTGKELIAGGRRPPAHAGPQRRREGRGIAGAPAG